MIVLYKLLYFLVSLPNEIYNIMYMNQVEYLIDKYFLNLQDNLFFFFNPEKMHSVGLFFSSSFEYAEL